jgi:periplasmic protein TonB
MNSIFVSWYFFILVTLVHLGGIAYVVIKSPNAEKKNTIEKPIIQGLLISPEKKEIPPKKQISSLSSEQSQPIPTLKRSHKHKPLAKALTPESLLKTSAPVPVEKTTEEPKPIVLPNTDAHEFNNVKPVYPAMSKKLQEEGVVLLTILVTKKGRVTKIEIKNSSGFKRLDDAAVNTIKYWQFNPATQAGEAIDYWYDIPVEFNLRKK